MPGVTTEKSSRPAARAMLRARDASLGERSHRRNRTPTAWRTAPRHQLLDAVHVADLGEIVIETGWSGAVTARIFNPSVGAAPHGGAHDLRFSGMPVEIRPGSPQARRRAAPPAVAPMSCGFQSRNTRLPAAFGERASARALPSVANSRRPSLVEVGNVNQSLGQGLDWVVSGTSRATIRRGSCKPSGAVISVSRLRRAPASATAAARRIILSSSKAGRVE